MAVVAEVMPSLMEFRTNSNAPVAVIAINGAMFSIEMAAGAFAGSKALQADALDFLGDTVTYALSLYVIGMSLRVRATAALIKGLSLGAMGLWVFSSTAYQVLVLGVPSAEIMGALVC